MDEDDPSLLDLAFRIVVGTGIGCVTLVSLTAVLLVGIWLLAAASVGS